MTQILHLSYDLRGRKNQEVTTAVKNLINITINEFNPFVIDLVRVPKFKEELIDFKSDRHLMMNVLGFSYGLFMLWSQKRAFKKILKLNNEGLINLKEFTIIHAHKLTFEGYIGYKLSKLLNIPLIITLRQTDISVLLYKPFLKGLYKEILAHSSIIFYINPYTKVLMEKRLGSNFYKKILKDKLVIIPNIVERDISISSHDSEYQQNLLTILRMDKRSVKRKNLRRLLQAFSLIKDNNIKLNIIGSGDYYYKIVKWVKKLDIESRVSFLGGIPNNKIDKYYADSLAFLLPSNSETFGLVYAEALINGTPILYSKDRLGFDGYFENVGPAVNPMSVQSIKDGILECLNNNSFYRQNISILKSHGAFKIFSVESVEEIYSKEVKKILKISNKI